MFRITEIESLWPEMEARSVNFARVARHPLRQATETRSAFGRAVVVDLDRYDVDVLPFFDLINSDKGTDASVGCCPEDTVNLGATVKDFIEGSRRESAKEKGKEGVYASMARRCVYASNALHTNFVRPNGFVIREGKVIRKPQQYDALGLDCEKFMPLEGSYTAFTMRGGRAALEPLVFEKEEKEEEPMDLPDLGISGPALIRDGKDVSATIPFRPRPGTPEPYGVPNGAPYLIDLPGPTEGDEVNYPPPTTMTSFAALGATEDNRIVAVAMFEDMRGEGNGCNLGITAWEMATLFFELEVGIKDAILGGGGADTQQFLRGGRPQYLVAPVRARSPGQGPRPEVEGPRGLGAIFAVMAKALA